MICYINISNNTIINDWGRQDEGTTGNEGATPAGFGPGEGLGLELPHRLAEMGHDVTSVQVPSPKVTS